jgi:hypothetical protein
MPQVAQSLAAANQLLIQPSGTDHARLSLDGQVRLQFHGHATQALRVVLAATLGQIVRHLPQPLGHALHDPGAAQSFQSADVSGDDLPRVAPGNGLSLRDRQVMIGAVQAIARQGGHVAVGRAHVGRSLHLHHGAGGIVRQLLVGIERDVVSLAIGAVDDQIAPGRAARRPVPSRRRDQRPCGRPRSGPIFPLPCQSW